MSIMLYKVTVQMRTRWTPMSRISISQASKDFKVSRNTIYKALEKGKLTRDANGKVDTIDLIRLFSEHTSTGQLALKLLRNSVILPGCCCNTFSCFNKESCSSTSLFLFGIFESFTCVDEFSDDEVDLVCWIAAEEAVLFQTTIPTKTTRTIIIVSNSLLFIQRSVVMDCN